MKKILMAVAGACRKRGQRAYEDAGGALAADGKTLRPSTGAKEAGQ